MVGSRHLKTLAMAGAAVLVSAGVANAQAMAPKKPAAVPKPFTLTSKSFKDGTLMPRKMANAGADKNPNCVGQNVSPELSWANPPEGTKSYILLMLDPEGRPPGGVSHWVAYGIPASVTGFKEGETSKQTDKFVGGKSTQGVGHYSGPCTPPGAPHHYIFTLIATDLEPTALKPGMTREEVIKEATGHAKGATGLVGLFKHP
jgi:Raf kinase inhibitor-like YbhB/YbcL family protein